MFIATNTLGGSSLPMLLLTYGALFAVLYFVFIRPNSKKKKQLQEMRNNIERGNKIVTIGGFIGTVESVKEDEIVFKCNGNSLKIKRNAIHTVINDQEV